MDYKNCEQYVLAELEKAQNEVADLNDFIKCQHKEIIELRKKVEDLELTLRVNSLTASCKELSSLDIE